MRGALRRLEAIHDCTSPSEAAGSSSGAAHLAALDEAKRKKLEKLTPYKRSEFQCMEAIAQLRFHLTKCAENTESLRRQGCNVDHSATALTVTSTAEQAMLQQELLQHRQNARRVHQQLQTLQREAEKIVRAATASAASTTSSSPASRYVHPPQELEYRQLCEHIDNARRWYREEFNISVISSSDASSAMLRGGASIIPAVFDDAPGGDGGGGGAADAGASVRHAREEAEFQEFFMDVKHQDDLMDEALDRIAEGVSRLRDNAVNISDELQAQAIYLNEAEGNVEQNQQELRSLNKRLHRAIRDMKASTACSYVCCLLCLVLVLSVLAKVAS